jgi:CelD/BcsL family acetyltransferase involved in cellulose biosynthesis
LTNAFHGCVRTVAAQDFDSLKPHLAAWDRLAWESPQRLPTLLPAWVDASFRHGLGPDTRWLCCFAYEDERLVGVMPVVVGRSRILGQEMPLLSTNSEFTPTGDILLAPDRAAEALKALLAEVGRHLPMHLGLDLVAVRQSSPVWAALQEGLDGYIVRRSSRDRYSFLAVKGCFEAYMKSLGKMRRNVRIGRKRLESRGRIFIEMRRGEHAGVDFLPEFLALEASGWKGRKGTAILNEPDKLAFYTALVENFAAQGRLEWHLIRVDGQLAAAGIGLRCGASLMLPKYAFNEDYAACMPGSLLTEEIFRDAFSRPEIEEVNHMSYSESDRLWHMPQDTYVHLHLVRRSPVAVLVRLPRLMARSAYQAHVQPRIPAFVREVQRKFQRRGNRRPPRIGGDGEIGAAVSDAS